MVEEAFAQAFAQAQEAFLADEVPIGAVITQGEKVIAKGQNQIKRLADPTAHAEMLAIRQAAQTLRSERLPNCELFTTLEPCTMCTGAIILARISRVHFLAKDDKLLTLRQIVEMPGHNHTLAWQQHSFEQFDSVALLQRFFQQKRAKK